MYYPVQLPNVFDEEFNETVDYNEEIIPELSDFVICLWSMKPKTSNIKYVRDLVLIDACTELVMDATSKTIMFAGPSLTKTAYEEGTRCYESYIGIKFKPGAFTQLTGLDAAVVDGKYLDLSEFDLTFSPKNLRNLNFNESKLWLINYIKRLTHSKIPNEYVQLFDKYHNEPPISATVFYDEFLYSPRQTQRLFLKNFGLNPKMVLTVLRFQYCLRLLYQKEVVPKEMLDKIQFSDQSHFIREFKKYVGLTPYEFLEKIKDDVFLL